MTVQQQTDERINHAHEIHYRFTRSDWWPREWPAVICWGGIGIGTLALIGVLTTQSLWWLLMLLPWWLSVGWRAISLFRILFIGRQAVVLRLVPGEKAAVSADNGRTWMSLFAVEFDRGDCPMLYANFGTVHLPVPLNRLTDDERRTLTTWLDAPQQHAANSPS